MVFKCQALTIKIVNSHILNNSTIFSFFKICTREFISKFIVHLKNIFEENLNSV